MPIQRRAVTVRSKVDLKVLRLLATKRCLDQRGLSKSHYRHSPMIPIWLTLLIVLCQNLVMAPPQLRPLGELVLRTGSVHLPFQAYHFPPQLDLRPGIGRGRRRKLVVEAP